MSIKEALVKLLKVKSIISITLIGAFIALAFTGDITGEQVNNLALMVVSFFFGKQSAKKGTDKNESKSE
jgi:uncharacterized membrane protein